MFLNGIVMIIGNNLITGNTNANVLKRVQHRFYGGTYNGMVMVLRLSRQLIRVSCSDLTFVINMRSKVRQECGDFGQNRATQDVGGPMMLPVSGIACPDLCMACEVKVVRGNNGDNGQNC